MPNMLPFLLSAVLAQPAPTLDGTKLRPAIQARYNQWCQAAAKGDVDKQAEVLSPIFMYVDATGNVTPRKPYLESLQAQAQSVRKVNCLVKIEQLEVTKAVRATALVTRKVTMETKQGNAWKPTTTSVKTKDVWLQNRGQWMLARSEVTKGK
jgi:hypothetical protein